MGIDGAGRGIPDRIGDVKVQDPSQDEALDGRVSEQHDSVQSALQLHGAALDPRRSDLDAGLEGVGNIRSIIGYGYAT